MMAKSELKRVALEVAHAVAAACGRNFDDLEEFDLDAVVARARQNHGQTRALNFNPRQPKEVVVTWEAMRKPSGKYLVAGLARTAVWDTVKRSFRRPPTFLVDDVEPENLTAAVWRAIAGALDNVEKAKVGKAPPAPRSVSVRLYKLRNHVRGLCVRCPRPKAEPGSRHCSLHRGYFNAYQAERRPARANVAA